MITLHFHLQQQYKYDLFHINFTSAIVEVSQARKDLCSKNSARSLENIPPTRETLEQHTMRTVFQGAYIWGHVLLTQPVIPSPSAWGWEKDGTSRKPKWTTLPQAKGTCYELIHRLWL